MSFATDIEVYEASSLTIDATLVDVSEVESEEDKTYLQEHGSSILMIEAKADFAIKKIVATIQGRASLEKGKIIAEVQDRFREKFPGGRGLGKWYKSVGIPSTHTANKWAQAYRATAEFQELFDGLVEPEMVLECSDTTLERIKSLPLQYREEVMAEIAVGNPPNGAEVTKLSQKTEVKLSKAEELLAAAKARRDGASEKFEEVKADPDIPPSIHGEMNPKYKQANQAIQNADRAVENFEAQIAELQTQIEEERLRTAESQAREAKTNADLQKLKFDDARTREERIKRLTSSLTVGVPQALADLQKFFAEKDFYPEDVRNHVLEQATYLANYVGDQL